MQRSRLIVVLALMLIGGSALRGSLGAQSTPTKAKLSDRPGDAIYTPTKLEWAALELQASYGNTNYTSESPVMIQYVALGDGSTLLCLLQYPPDVPAGVVKLNRDSQQYAFDRYKGTRGWSWLRLQFDEHTLSGKSR